MTPGESPDDNSYGADNYAEQPDEFDKEEYLPEYQKLFPQFTLEDMDACACVILSGTTDAVHHIFIHTGMKNESKAVFYSDGDSDSDSDLRRESRKPFVLLQGFAAFLMTRPCKDFSACRRTQAGRG